jgi:hypothetical protein
VNELRAQHRKAEAEELDRKTSANAEVARSGYKTGWKVELHLHFIDESLLAHILPCVPSLLISAKYLREMRDGYGPGCGGRWVAIPSPEIHEDDDASVSSSSPKCGPVVVQCVELLEILVAGMGFETKVGRSKGPRLARKFEIRLTTATILAPIPTWVVLRLNE